MAQHRATSTRLWGIHAAMNKQSHIVEPSLFGETDDTGDDNAAKGTAYDHAKLFGRLAQSAFRSKFHLSASDRAYIERKGMATIRRHASDFVAKRLAPAVISNDGRQTPMRGHPVFVAQHATGCCCRGCLAKWHGIPAGRSLTSEEQAYVVSVLMAWIENELTSNAAAGGHGHL